MSLPAQPSSHLPMNFPPLILLLAPLPPPGLSPLTPTPCGKPLLCISIYIYRNLYIIIDITIYKYTLEYTYLSICKYIHFNQDR